MLTAAESRELLAERLRLGLRLGLRPEGKAALCTAALQLSQQQQGRIHEACCLALALRHGGVLLSADGQRAAAARR